MFDMKFCIGAMNILVKDKLAKYMVENYMRNLQ